MMRQQEVQQFLAAALECSVYVAPKDPGLTHAELFEAGGRVGYQEGELGDALGASPHRCTSGIRG